VPRRTHVIGWWTGCSGLDLVRVDPRHATQSTWIYGLLEVNDEAVNACIRHDYHAIIAPYWPEERRHVEESFRVEKVEILE
jgi:hypothetical protein